MLVPSCCMSRLSMGSSHTSGITCIRCWQRGEGCSALGDLPSDPSCLPPADRGEGEHQLRRVEGLAEAHAGHPQLFDLADILGDRCGWLGGLLGAWARGLATSSPVLLACFGILHAVA